MLLLGSRATLVNVAGRAASMLSKQVGVANNNVVVLVYIIRPCGWWSLCLPMLVRSVITE